jgi:metallo-beta-lactamase family protein
MDGAKKVNIHGVEVEVKAKIETILGYSSHKDSDRLVEFVSTVNDKRHDSVRQVFVVMGEPKASLFLVQKIRDNLGINAIYPERLEKYELK